MGTLLTQRNFEDIYEEYLRKEGSKNAIERYVGKGKWFNASNAGHCYRKHKYKMIEAKAESPDKKSLFRMRIGDLVHQDIQTALLKYYKDKLIMTEVEVEIKRLNVRGYLDLVFIDGTEADLKDIKTAAAFAWRRKFGRPENRDPNPSDKYELQVGTYALGLEDNKGLHVDNMDLIYYKKDDSGIKFVNINIEYKKKAENYWLEVLKACKQDVDKLVPGDEYGVPFESWECNYCQYKALCPSPFKKDK
jgi:CRISPR/Cas system-associated exonuclease Cas4 (RecB family)